MHTKILTRFLGKYIKYEDVALEILAKQYTQHNPEGLNSRLPVLHTFWPTSGQGDAWNPTGRVGIVYQW